MQFVQECKEEKISDSELMESSCDEENEGLAWYPSESAIEEWKQVKEKRNKYRELLKQGHCLLHLGLAKSLAKLDNIVSEHVNHNVGRLLVDFSCCS